MTKEEKDHLVDSGAVDYSIVRIEELRERAEGGCPEAQCDIASIYHSRAERGVKEVVEDDERRLAVRWMTMAADASYAEAQYLLGCWYRDGWGVAASPLMAFRMLRAAADSQKFRYAEFRLYAIHEVGLCYLHGIGVEANRAEAHVWFGRGADLDFARSQLMLALTWGLSPRSVPDNLGMTYGLSRESVSEDPHSDLMGILEKASMNGDRDAMGLFEGSPTEDVFLQRVKTLQRHLCQKSDVEYIHYPFD